MEMWMALAVILLSIGAWVISRCSLYVHIAYVKDAQTDRLRVSVKLFDWFQLYQRTREDLADAMVEKYVKKLFGQGPNQKARPSDGKARKVDYKSLLFDRFICRHLTCRIKISSADASRTAILYGSAYCVGHLLLTALMRRTKFTDIPEFTVEPEFYGGQSTLEFRCICSAKIGNVISMAKQYI